MQVVLSPILTKLKFPGEQNLNAFHSYKFDVNIRKACSESERGLQVSRKRNCSHSSQYVGFGGMGRK